MDRGWVKDVAIPLAGTLFAFFASILSAIVLIYTNNQTNNLQLRLQDIQRTQFEIEQRSQTDQFDRDSERQYVTLVYQDITSNDPERQRKALSLLGMLQPTTASKLLDLVNKAGFILPENKEQSKVVEKALDARSENARYRVFLHITPNSAGPSAADVSKALAASGFQVVGVDTHTQGTPAVEFFHSSDEAGARNAAVVLQTFGKQATPSLKTDNGADRNPAGYLGVWF